MLLGLVDDCVDARKVGFLGSSSDDDSNSVWTQAKLVEGWYVIDMCGWRLWLVLGRRTPRPEIGGDALLMSLCLVLYQQICVILHDLVKVKIHCLDHCRMPPVLDVV